MTPITNATPLIHLARIGRLDLLRLVFGELLVPTAVVGEVRPRIASALDAALAERWLVPATPLDTERTSELEGELGGAGEAAVIALALEHADSLVVVDERAARRVCARLGLRTRGTLGVLLDAKKAQHVPNVRAALDALVGGGFWLDPETRHRVLELAGEE